MTTTAHNARRVYGGATRKAAQRPPPNRPSQRRAVSWLHCPVDEFVRLLARHEAGEIDLREMPTEDQDEVNDLDEQFL